MHNMFVLENAIYTSQMTVNPIVVKTPFFKQYGDPTKFNTNYFGKQK